MWRGSDGFDLFLLLKDECMKYLMVGVVLLLSSGCKHLQKRVEVETLELVPPKVVKVDDKVERTRNITISIMPIQNLTFKAL
jgi:hypothetical protein